MNKKHLVTLCVLCVVIGWIIYLIPTLHGLMRGVSVRHNQEASFAAMKAIQVAQSVFKQKNGRYGMLSELADSNLISRKLASGESEGYTFEVKVQPDAYEVVAFPAQLRNNATGLWSYYVNETGIIRMSHDGKANLNALPAPNQ